MSITLTIIVISQIRNQLNEQEGYEQKSGDPKKRSDLQAVNIPSDHEEQLGTNSVGFDQNTFAQLIENADSGDPAAQYGAYKKLIECNGLIEASDIQLNITSATDFGTPYSDQYVDYLWSMHLECQSIPTEGLRKNVENARNYLHLAQQANYPAAVAIQLMDIAEEEGLTSSDDIALETLRSGDPEAIYNARPYFYGSSPDRVGRLT